MSVMSGYSRHAKSVWLYVSEDLEAVRQSEVFHGPIWCCSDGLSDGKRSMLGTFVVRRVF